MGSNKECINVAHFHIFYFCPFPISFKVKRFFSRQKRAYLFEDLETQVLSIVISHFNTLIQTRSSNEIFYNVVATVMCVKVQKNRKDYARILQRANV